MWCGHSCVLWTAAIAAGARFAGALENVSLLAWWPRIGSRGTLTPSASVPTTRSERVCGASGWPRFARVFSTSRSQSLNSTTPWQEALGRCL